MLKWLTSESMTYVYGEKMATLVRWATLILAGLLNNLVGGTESPAIVAFNGLVLTGALLNLVPTVALWRGFQPSRWFCRLSIGFDILLLTAMIFLRGGLSSTIYVLYFPVIFAAAIRFGLTEGLVDALIIGGTYATVTVITHPGGPLALEPLAGTQLLIRVLVFIAAALVSGLLTRQERTVRTLRAQRAADARLLTELTTLTEIGQALTSITRPDELLELIYQQVSRVLDARNFYIALYDEAQETLHFPVAVKAGQRRNWSSQRGGQGPAEHVIRTQRPLLVTGDVAHRFQELGIEFPGELPCSWLGVPLLAGERAVGVIAVQSYEPTHSYDEGHQRLLSTIAAQAAIALENIRLLQKAEHRARELTSLYEVGQVITSSLDLDTVLKRIMHAAVDLLEVEAGSLVLVDPHSQDLVFRIALGARSEQVQQLRLPAGTGIMGQVAATGQSIIVNDAQNDPRFYRGADTLSGFHTRSILAAPLRAHDQVIGVVEVMNRIDGQPFLPEHRDLLTTFADQAAIAIENAQVYQRTDEALARRVRELTAIAEVDHRLSATLDFESVNTLVVQEAMQATHASAGLMAILDETRTGLLLLAQQGYPEDIRRYQFEPWPVERGITGRVARTGQPILVPDVQTDPDYVAFVPTTRSLLSVPVLQEDQVLGVVTLESDRPANFTADDLRFVQHLAEHAAIAMQNAKLFADLQRANRELQALSDAKTEFVSIVSHELRAPLTSIKGYVDLILEDETISEDVRDFLGVVQQNADRLGKLVADLLDVSRIEAGRIHLTRGPLDLADIVDTVLSTAAAEIQAKELTVTVDLPADLPPVWGDRDRVTQIMTNLVSNAVKYTPSGGVYISARPGGETTPAGLDRGQYAQITVRDTGIGITPADQARLFTKFFRADHPLVRQVPGTGLGLSIVKSLVELHGGRVWVDSQVDQGSAFHFTLPIVASQAADPPDNAWKRQ